MLFERHMLFERVTFISFVALLSLAPSRMASAQVPEPAPAPAPAAPAPEPTAPPPPETALAPATPAAPPGATAPPADGPERPAPPSEPPPAEARPLDAAPNAAEPAPEPPAPTQLKLEIPNGTSIRFGLFWQGQYEARGNSQNEDMTHNLFIRRFALLIGGTVLHDFEYFFDTDFADLLKAPTGPDSLKNGPGIATKDAFATYRAIEDQLKIDAGLFLPPGAHNTLEGGPVTHAWDFFFNSFRHAGAFGSTANTYGRDAGVQLRGLVVGDGLIEYRLGAFQGFRRPPSTDPSAPAARNPFRYAGRVQLNFLDAEPGFFYRGTYLGTKSIFSVGGSADYQYDEDGGYRAYGGDVLLDVPLGPGGLTTQINVVHRNGGDLVALPKQTAFMAEAGYRIAALKLSPIVRFERRWQEADAGDETDFGGGLAYWWRDYNSNLKAFYTRLVPEEPTEPFDQFNLQWQLFFY